MAPTAATQRATLAEFMRATGATERVALKVRAWISFFCFRYMLDFALLFSLPLPLDIFEFIAPVSYLCVL